MSTSWAEALVTPLGQLLIGVALVLGASWLAWDMWRERPKTRPALDEAASARPPEEALSAGGPALVLAEWGVALFGCLPLVLGVLVVLAGLVIGVWVFLVRMPGWGLPVLGPLMAVTLLILASYPLADLLSVGRDIYQSQGVIPVASDPPPPATWRYWRSFICWTGISSLPALGITWALLTRGGALSIVAGLAILGGLAYAILWLFRRARITLRWEARWRAARRAGCRCDWGWAEVKGLVFSHPRYKWQPECPIHKPSPAGPTERDV